MRNPKKNPQRTVTRVQNLNQPLRTSYIHRKTAVNSATSTKPPGLVVWPIAVQSLTFFLLFWLSAYSSVFANNTLGNPQSTSPPTDSTPNALFQHASPYLAMHGDDPVQWLSWDAQVLKKAQQQNKPILISSGYFACHWCHVMQAESYQNLATANDLNKHFIAVKIDRELNPELDRYLVDFAQQTIGHSGWPLHVILTPKGYPFAAFTYLPKADFANRLTKVDSLWQKQAAQINQLAQTQAAASQTLHVSPISQQTFITHLLAQLENAKDEISGGLQGATKFPNAPLLASLLQRADLPSSIEEWLILTLDQMQNQHLYDHVNGGFYRYTVDPEWQIPHFEKMAYTNALLADIYLQAGLRWQREDYLQTAQQTISYLDSQLYNPVTQLYQSSQSAVDQQQQEGGDYLFSKTALTERLNPGELQIVSQAWQLTQPSPHDLGWHPMPTSHHWASIQKKLHVKPGQVPLDDKSLLGWNGLMLSTLSRAYQVLKKPHYRRQANRLAKRLQDLIALQQPPRALSATGQPMGLANLEDYAYILKGLKDWQGMVLDARVENSGVDFIVMLEDRIRALFYSEHGWRFHITPLLPGQQAEWAMMEDAVPSPTALVSCLQPSTLGKIGKTLTNDPLSYPSYMQTLSCVRQLTNNVK